MGLENSESDLRNLCITHMPEWILKIVHLQLIVEKLKKGRLVKWLGCWFRASSALHRLYKLLYSFISP